MLKKGLIFTYMFCPLIVMKYAILIILYAASNQAVDIGMWKNTVLYYIILKQDRDIWNMCILGIFMEREESDLEKVEYVEEYLQSSRTYQVSFYVYSVTNHTLLSLTNYGISLDYKCNKVNILIKKRTQFLVYKVYITRNRCPNFT